MRKLITLISCIFLWTVLSSFAWWGQTGHRVIGEIADSYLSKKARTAIQEILGNETIAMSSNWADFIKSDSAFNYLSTWHYINLPQGLSQADFKAALQKDTSANAFTRLNFLITELKNKQLAMDKKQMYLRLLIHIVGDLHQPLHIGRFDDLGGNRIRVQWFGDPTNLHSVWDEKLIDFQKLSYTEYVNAINHTTRAERIQWQSQTMSDWFYETYQLTGKVYASISGNEPKLGFRYNFDNIDLLNRQLLKGGVRLAGLLNSIFN